ncbi:MAG TPA: NUDIX hydrolase [Bradyrhizobium sp.]|nr:NUDIX hydrolase [Bradyrhizobium sp.]
MAREPVLAAGGIVLRRGQSPRIAIVRLRKRDEWVLPKGKLDNGETARDAAEREVLEETGHDVTVHEFLGTLAYESGGRSKIVHYWRMEAEGEQAYELMRDIRAVDWLPLDLAIGRLSRAYERAFLTHVGPHALENAALAEASRRAKAKAPEAKKRRSRQAPAPKLPLPEPALPQSEIVPQPSPAELELPALDLQPPVPLLAGEFIEVEPPVEEIEAALPVQSEHAEPAPIETTSHGAAVADADTNAELASDASDPDAEGRRPTLAQKVRAWLGRAA